MNALVTQHRVDRLAWAVLSAHLDEYGWALVERHGVSRRRSGRRHTVGVIFHDAT